MKTRKSKTQKEYSPDDTLPQNGENVAADEIKLNTGSNPSDKDKHNKKNKQPKKKGFKRFLPLIIVLFVAVISGSALGYWYYKSSQIDDTIYDKYSEADLIDNQTTMLNKILGTTGDEGLENAVSLAKSKGLNPTKLSAAENVAFAQFNLSNATSFEAFGVGEVDTIAKQTIYSVKKFDGQTYTFESISKGTLTIADLSVFEKDATQVRVIKGTNIKADSATWDGKSTPYSANEFKNLAGNLPNAVIPYIISSKTIEKETKPEESFSESGKKLYTFSVQLNKITGAVNYCRQVKMTSGLDKRPLFDDITLTFTIDEDWNFVRYEVDEHYSVFYIVKAKCHGTLVTDFKINEDITLPEYSI